MEGRSGKLDGVKLSPEEKKSMNDISGLAERIYVRAVVNTGDLAGVTTASQGEAEMSIEATRMLHRREAELAFEAAMAFYRVKAESMAKIGQAQRAAEAAEVAAEAAQAAEDAAAAAVAAAAAAEAAKL